MGKHIINCLNCNKETIKKKYCCRSCRDIYVKEHKLSIFNNKEFQKWVSITGKEKRKKTLIEKYGTNYASIRAKKGWINKNDRVKRFNKTRVTTLIKRYGVDNVRKIDWVKDKIQATTIKRFGNGKNLWKNKKYNFNNIIMRSSWEVKIAERLDLYNIAFKYESEVFKLNCGYYIPDFFIPEFNSYIEVKGYKHPKAMEKINEFSNKHNLLLIDENIYHLIDEYYINPKILIELNNTIKN